MRLVGSVANVSDVGKRDRDRMFALMDRMYVNMRRDSFESDLDAKQWLIRLDDPVQDQLVGFSTQTLIEIQLDGLPIRALFSGDTVVDRQKWGDTALASTWGSFALELIDRFGRTPLYWFLISKGFRTYRYLPLFFRDYCPRLDHHAPDALLRIVNALGQRVAPRSYDPESQIIRADSAKEFVRPEYGDASARVSLDPHVRYFVQRNPDHHRGDELCCLAPLTGNNFTRLAWRMIRSSDRPSCSC